jgi:iron complex outermembrane receptor protein
VPGWVVMKPSVGQSSNCIFPEYVAAALIQAYQGGGEGNIGVTSCGMAYSAHIDPVTSNFYNPATTSFTGPPNSTVYPYPGFDPLSADPNAPAGVNNGLGLPPNNGEGFAKNVGGNELPNAPHYTVSLTGDYTMPVSDNWAATLHSDFYWQSQSFARVFNDRPYDKIRGYSNVNTALILTDASGWQVMGYVKNIFNTTAITGDFLNSDDSGLTTNIFLTDPRLYGVRVTKHFDDGGAPGGGFDLFSNNDADNKRPQIWLTLGGDFAMMGASQQPYVPPFSSLIVSDLPTPAEIQKTPMAGFDWSASLSYQPDDSDWVLKAGIRYGRSLRKNNTHKSQPLQTRDFKYQSGAKVQCPEVNPYPNYASLCRSAYINNFVDAQDRESERHMMIDFTLGKDVGIGMFGEGSKQTLSAGVRVAQFTSGNSGLFNSDPNYYFGPKTGPFQKYHNIYTAGMQEKRSFNGIGPEVTWDASSPVLGDPASGQLALDWGINAAVLFGRQRVNIHHQRSQCHFSHAGLQSLYTCYTVPSQNKTETIKRSRSVTVPNLGGYLGLSVLYNDAKVSFGYRTDDFFGAMDGGEDNAKRFNRSFSGPYMNLSLGFGG